MMAGKGKETDAAEQIARINPGLIFGPHCLATDPAVGGIEHTDFFVELDKPTQNKVMVARLEAEAAVHKALSDGHSKVAAVLKSGG
jgi:hypothetical protein